MKLIMDRKWKESLGKIRKKGKYLFLDLTQKLVAVMNQHRD